MTTIFDNSRMGERLGDDGAKEIAFAYRPVIDGVKGDPVEFDRVRIGIGQSARVKWPKSVIRARPGSGSGGSG